MRNDLASASLIQPSLEMTVDHFKSDTEDMQEDVLEDSNMSESNKEEDDTPMIICQKTISQDISKNTYQNSKPVGFETDRNRKESVGGKSQGSLKVLPSRKHLTTESTFQPVVGDILNDKNHNIRTYLHIIDKQDPNKLSNFNHERAPLQGGQHGSYTSGGSAVTAYGKSCCKTHMDKHEESGLGVWATGGAGWTKAMDTKLIRACHESNKCHFKHGILTGPWADITFTLSKEPEFQSIAKAYLKDKIVWLKDRMIYLIEKHVGQEENSGHSNVEEDYMLRDIVSHEKTPWDKQRTSNEEQRYFTKEMDIKLIRACNTAYHNRFQEGEIFLPWAHITSILNKEPEFNSQEIIKNANGKNKDRMSFLIAQHILKVSNQGQEESSRVKPSEEESLLNEMLWMHKSFKYPDSETNAQMSFQTAEKKKSEKRVSTLEYSPASSFSLRFSAAMDLRLIKACHEADLGQFSKGETFLPWTHIVTILIKEPDFNGCKKNLTAAIGRIRNRAFVLIDKYIQKMRKTAIGLGVKLKPNPEERDMLCELARMHVRLQSSDNKHTLQERLVAVCKSCGESFPSFATRKMHMQIKHNIVSQSYDCYLCSEAFPKIDEFVNHLRSVHKYKKITSLSSSTYAKLKKLKKKKSCSTILEMDPYMCELCGVHLFSKNQMTYHKKKHEEDKTPPNTFLCCQCSMTFTKRAKFDYHMAKHQGFQCDYCDHRRPYAKKSNLRFHIRSTHTLVKTVKCDLCPEMFLNHYWRRTHVSKVHTEKPFECTNCDYKTNISNYFNKHVKYRCTYRLSNCIYTCSTCKQTFSKQHDWYKHHLTHFPERRFNCNVCHASYRKPGSLWAHKQKHKKTKFS